MGDKKNERKWMQKRAHSICISIDEYVKGTVLMNGNLFSLINKTKKSFPNMRIVTLLVRWCIILDRFSVCIFNLNINKQT